MNILEFWWYFDRFDWVKDSLTQFLEGWKQFGTGLLLIVTSLLAISFFWIVIPIRAYFPIKRAKKEIAFWNKAVKDFIVEKEEC